MDLVYIILFQKKILKMISILNIVDFLIYFKLQQKLNYLNKMTFIENNFRPFVSDFQNYSAKCEVK